MATWEHECSCIAKIFSSKEKADLLIEEINEYSKSRPNDCADILNDSQTYDYIEQYDKWSAKYPLGDKFASADYFKVEEHEVHN